MSDGAAKPSDETPADTVVKRVGRARICKECRFTTTDVREFSNHRLHAHAEQTEESTVTKKGSVRRKTSLASSVGEASATEQNTDTNGKDTEQKISKDIEKNINKDTEQNINKDTEQKKCKDIEQNISKDTEPYPSKAEERTSKTNLTATELNKSEIQPIMENIKPEINMEQCTPMESEQTTEPTISDELLNSLSLKKLTKTPEKEKASIETVENGISDTEKDALRRKRPSTEKLVMEHMNGHSEEILLVNNEYDQDQDDEPRLVIADEGSEFDDGMENPDSESPILTRTGNIQNRTYICSICDYSTTSAKSYLHHQKDYHYLDIIIYECDICEYATKYKQKLPRHRKLHFTGKDGMLSESDLDLSLTERDLKDMRERALMEHMANGEEDMEDEGEGEDEEEDEMVPGLRLTTSNMVTMPTLDVKKKRVRQEVDPLKYYEVVDDNGVKYACSKCGNVYKWRKSLNKHWKEKHFGDVPDLTKPPPTLQNYTLFSRFKSKFGGQGNPPAAPNVVYGAAVAVASPTQANKNNNNSSSSGSKPDENKQPANPPVIMPKFIGPFIGGTSQSAIIQGGILSQPPQLTPERQKEIRQMMAAIQNQSRMEHRQLDQTRIDQVSLFQNTITTSTDAFQRNSDASADDQPLDFSVKKEPGVQIKPEPYWSNVAGDSNSLYHKSNLFMMSPPTSTSNSAGDNSKQLTDSSKQQQQQQQLQLQQLQQQLQQHQLQQAAQMGENPVLQCSKCSFVAKTLVEYSSHMSLHLNKRAFKCAECQAHFNGVEDLNKHFSDLHSLKIHEHKEAIQKIPHGLQQTYHLLKMPLETISTLSSHDVLANEPKQLKCSMCQFVAKWPAELQKHAVSHSEERPFICMVCGSTYKWKWDLVKHFEKSHSSLPNPYKRREGGSAAPPSKGMYDESSSTPPPVMSKTAAALIDASITGVNYVMDGEAPPSKKRRMSDSEMQERANMVLEQIQQAAAKTFETPTSSTGTNQMPNRPPSEPMEPFQPPKIYVNEHGQLSLDPQMMEDQRSENMSAKLNRQKQVADALKNRIASGGLVQETPPKDSTGKSGKTAYSDILLPYKCTICEYRARWPSEISQHMKNHSNEKPFHCPRCSYKSKWKWDVVKHLRRCGGGTVHDVIDTTKIMKKLAPPNVTVMPYGNMHLQGGNQPVFPGIQPMTSPSSCSTSSIQNSFSIASPAKLPVSDSHPGEHISPISKQPVFRSLINQGLLHCLECPFVGNSTAELRRHAVLHSENKPFVCTQCGYSSRWKSDLKKHLKTYNHYSTMSPSLDANSEDEDHEEKPYTDMELESEDDDQRSTLYMCPKCPYNSYKKHAYELHLQIHGDQMEESVEAAAPMSNSSTLASSAKYKCNKCDYAGNDLSSFLQHKMVHNQSSVPANNSSFSPANISSSEPTGQPTDVSNRTLHLKQRRKPIKQFRCPKCPYVCFKRTGLTIHETMHEPRGTDAYLCMFCDYNVFSKSLVLQHMRLHPEYNPSECADIGQVGSAELQEIEEMEEKESAKTARKMMEENNNVSAYESGLESADAMVNNLSKQSTLQDGLVSLSPAQLFSSQQRQSAASEVNNNDKDEGGLPCEWCSQLFPNVVTLYHHCQKEHPAQLKDQEAGDVAATQAPARQSQLEQIVRERQREYMVYHQFMSRQQPQIQQQIQSHLQNQTQGMAAARRLVPLMPKMTTSPTQQTSPTMAHGSSPSTSQEYTANLSQSQLSPGQLAAMKARKSTNRQNRSRSFQCTKCSFTAPNAVTYLRHIERHGSNCKHTCQFCDYSIDRLNLLYQHMKGTHSNLWQGTAEEKINLSVNGDDNNNIIGMPRESPTDSFNMSDSEDLNASFNSSFNESNDGEAEMRAAFDGGILSMFQAKGIKPVLIVKDEIQWRGIPVQVCTLDGKKHYKCPWCLYISSNAANTTNHIRQHGSNRKYTCPHCDYSVDNIKIIQHHIETVHPKDPNFIQVINQPYSVSEPSTNQADFEDTPQSNSKPDSGLTGQKSDVASSPGGNSNVDVFECPKCPYKTQEKRRLQSHLERHVYRGKYACQLCDYSVDKYNFLRVHARLHNTTNQGGSNMTMDVDDDDGEWFENNIPSDMRRTKLEFPADTKEAQLMEEILEKLRKNNGHVQFKCSCCPYHTEKKTNIVSHRSHHINKSSLSCHLCTFSASQTFILNQHMKFHEQLQQFGMSTKTENEIIVDPYSETLSKLVEQLPMDDGDDMEEMEEGGEFQDGMDVYDGEGSGIDSDDDVEAAMMEQELRESTMDTKSSSIVEKNLNSEFDRELQFRTFKCQDCPYSSNSNSEFHKHGRLHGMNLKFKCDYCSYSLDRVNLLQQHRKLHFQEADFNSAPLTSQLLNQNHEDYEANMAKVGSEIAFPPSDSGSRNADDKMAEFYNIQQKSFIGSSSNDDKLHIRYSCNKCPYRCNALKSFKCHIQMHGLSRKYKCDYCNWSADRLNLLYQHRKVHAFEPEFNPNPGEIAFLNREYALESNTIGSGIVGLALEQHSENPFQSGDLSKLTGGTGNFSPQKTGDGQKIHYCKLCPFTTDSNNNYSYHKKLHCIQARYTCSECSFSINNWTSLSEHIKLHKKEQKMLKATMSDSKVLYKCPKCPYSSPTKNLLAVHTTMHASGRKHECTKCDFSVDKYDLLLLHNKVHMDGYEPANSLEELELAMKRTPDVIGPEVYFTSPVIMEMDSDSNGSSSPEHKCDKCPYSTPSKDELTTHVANHNNTNKNKCMYCTFSCGKEDQLLDHTQLHFPSTRLDKEILRIMKRQGDGYRRNISKGLDDPKEGDTRLSEVETGEPDSTVTESPKKEEGGESTGQSTDEQGQEIKEIESKTKVYVCQYCEREFDSKLSMLQHEKQHLVGYQL